MTDPTVEERLAELEAASDARRAELRAVLDDLPAALSRRALVRSAAADLRNAPGKSEVVRRAVNKVVLSVRRAVQRALPGER